MQAKKIIASVVQTGSVAFNLDASLSRLEAHIRKAAAAGSKLVVFPEAYLGTYPKGMDFGARVGQRSQEGRDWFAQYYENAVDMDGLHMKTLASLATELGIIIHGGIIERDGGTLYCTAVTIGLDGQLLARHRKVMPTASERLIWGFGDGSTLSAAKTEFGTVGGGICWENYMPAYRLHQYAQDVDFYCTPTVDDRDQWQNTMRHIAYEGRCFVLSACQYSVRSDYPDNYEYLPLEDPNSLIRGGSVIISPMGRILAGPVYGKEIVLTAELDLSERAKGRFDLDVAGHYGRPDIFQLDVNVSGPRVVTENKISG